MNTFYTLATSTFASTTGITPAQIASFATSSVMKVYIGTILSFLEKDTRGIIAYGMIILILLVVVRVFIFYKRV